MTAKLPPPVTYIGNFLSVHGTTPTYAEELVPALRAAGFDVTSASATLPLVRRLVDQVRAVLRSPRNGCVVIDLYSSRNAFYAGLVNVIACRLRRRPYVITLHGGELPARKRRSPRLVRFIVRGAANVTAPSPYLARAFGDLVDVTVIPNGIDLSAYQSRVRDAPAPNLLYLRSFARIYGCVTLVEAMPAVVERHPTAMLDMIGPDKDGSSEACRVTADRLGVGDRVRICGRIPKSEVAQLGATHDVFVNPTLADNAPVSVIEAMAMGMCVVSTNVGGLTDLLVDCDTALLVEPRDPRLLADAVLRLLDDHELAARLSTRARQVAESMDWAIVVPQWGRLLDRVGGERA